MPKLKRKSQVMINKHDLIRKKPKLKEDDMVQPIKQFGRRSKIIIMRI